MNPPAHVRLARHGRVLAALVALACLAGCYERTANGTQAIYRAAWWSGPLLTGISLATLLVGWGLYKWSKKPPAAGASLKHQALAMGKTWSWKWGLVLIFMPVVMLTIVVPALYIDKAVLDDDHCEARYGFWFMPTERTLRFQDFREIRHVAVRDQRGRTTCELHCTSISGELQVFPVGDLMGCVVPELLARAKARGVTVVDEVP